MEHVSSVALIFQAHASAEASRAALFVKLIEHLWRRGRFCDRLTPGLKPRQPRLALLQLLEFLLDLGLAFLLLLHLFKQLAFILLQELFALGQSLALFLSEDS